VRERLITGEQVLGKAKVSEKEHPGHPVVQRSESAAHLRREYHWAVEPGYLDPACDAVPASTHGSRGASSGQQPLAAALAPATQRGQCRAVCLPGGPALQSEATTSSGANDMSSLEVHNPPLQPTLKQQAQDQQHSSISIGPPLPVHRSPAFFNFVSLHLFSPLPNARSIARGTGSQ
jgi:hypothetical protein